MKLNRRHFLKAAAALSSAKLIEPALAAAEELAATDTSAEGLPRRILGKTKVPVTILGLGCAYISHDNATVAQTRATLEAALEEGIRYFDTAPDYVLSEERIGPVLAPVRDRIFLVTKLDHIDAESAEKDLANSLKLLKTTHVDLLLLHGLGLPGWQDTDTLLGNRGALRYLFDAKEKGLTRFIGFSTHPQHPAALKVFAAAGTDLDVVMPFVNYISRTENNEEQRIVERARKIGLGVTAMKVLGGSGQMADDYDRALRYTLSVPGVNCALIGVRNVAQVKRAVQAAKAFRPMTSTEMEETIAIGRRLIESRSKKAAMLNQHRERDCGATVES
ncbi:MAG: aldo/keto reductase [Candidatus Omnitrophica bacterium]|nr:aldo/keto reductase [Candidatus Omnitrophota bacterium]